VPNEPITETVRRIQAEYHLDKARKDVKFIESVWINKYTKLSTAYNKLTGAYNKQEKFFKSVIEDLKKTRDRLGTSVEDLRVENRELKGNFADATRTSTKYEKLVTDLKIAVEDLKRKYHGALATNLELSRKNTKANEDYLELATRLERAEEALKKKDILAKKSIKVHVK